jgi:hypothetical protein
VQAKLEGTRRVVGVAFGHYARPVVATPDELVPSRDTCERCHSPATFHGDTMRRVVEYADDEANTESVTTLRMHVGGGDGPRGPVRGIHWHANPAIRVDYVATDEGGRRFPTCA